MIITTVRGCSLCLRSHVTMKTNEMTRPFSMGAIVGVLWSYTATELFGFRSRVFGEIAGITKLFHPPPGEGKNYSSSG